MTSINYNPDVLLCLANLSNDEVFTPPELANSILDLLPKDIWKNKDAKDKSKGFAGNLGSQWYWYESWFDHALGHCFQQGEKYR